MKDADTHPDRSKSPMKWVWRILLAVVILLLLLALVAYFGRRALVRQAVTGYCTDRGIVCDVNVDTLSCILLEASDIRVSNDGFVPFEADKFVAHLDWPTPFKAPRILAVELDAPTAVAKLERGEVSFGGLEQLFETSEDDGGNDGSDFVPDITIRNGRAALITSVGEISARLDSVVFSGSTGQITADIEPSDLVTPNGHVKWSTGSVILNRNNDQIDGEISLILESAQSDGIEVENGELFAEYSLSLDANAAMTVEWSVLADAAMWNDASLNGVQSQGVASLASRPEPSLQDITRKLDSVQAVVKSKKAAYAQNEVSTFDGLIDLTQSETGLAGPVRMTMNNAVTAQISAGQIDIDGLVWRDADGFLTYGGDTVVQKGRVQSELKQQIIAPIGLPGPLQPHGEDLQGIVSSAADDFDFSTVLQASLRDDGLYLISAVPTTLKGESGFAIQASPVGSEPWLTYSENSLSLKGNFNLSGGGAPNLKARVTNLSQSDSGFEFAGKSLKLAPWSKAGRTVSADVSVFEIGVGGDNIHAELAGDIGLDGEFSGSRLSQTNLSGDVIADYQDNAWKVVTERAPCLKLNTNGVVFGGMSFGSLDTDICPEDGEFIRQQGADLNGPSGGLALGELRLPFATASSSGSISLDNAFVDWASADGLSLFVRADDMTLPVKIGQRDLLIEGETPRIGVLAGEGPMRFSVELKETNYTGSLVPANLSSTAFKFQGRSEEEGISGNLSADRLILRDKQADALYQPLVTDIRANLDRGQLTFTSPVRMLKGGISVADATLDLDVVKLDGTLDIKSRNLNFVKGGLQPVMLSERFRGVFTDATGALLSDAKLVISGGNVTATGSMSADNFGFQTTRLGRVENVNGMLQFSDLLKLTTEPDQVITVASLNPGVPLKDGKIVFQLIDGRRFDIATAEFPLAGGRIMLAPMSWRVGANTQTALVNAEAIELEELISLFRVPDLKASGTVSGKVPISIEQNSMFIRNARLKADESGGRLSYATEDTASLASSNESLELAMAALENLEFSVLEVGVDGNLVGRLVVSADILGRNPEIWGGTEFKFGINVDSNLSQLLKTLNQEQLQSTALDMVVEEIGRLNSEN